MCDGAHAGQDLITVCRGAKTLPFGHPVAGICQPVGSDTQAGRGLAGIEAARLCQTHGVEVIQQGVGIPLLTHQVTGALVGCEVVEETVEGGLTDAGFLGATPPVGDIMTAAQRCPGTDMVGVHLTAMACHGCCHAEDITAAGAQEVIPQPHGGGKLGIVPGKAAHVVAPIPTLIIIRVHQVSVVPEAIPLISFDILLVIGDQQGEALLHTVGAVVG